MKKCNLFEELLEILEEEPQDVSLEEMAKEGTIRIFREPEHSREVILRFQTKYAIHSLEVIGEDCPALQWVTETDLSKWRFAIDQFTKAGGVLKDLPLDEYEDWFRGYEAGTGSISPVTKKGRGSFALPFDVAASA